MVSRWVPRALRTCSRDAQALGSLLSARPSPNASNASTRSAAPRSSACRAWNTWLDTLTHNVPDPPAAEPGVILSSRICNQPTFYPRKLIPTPRTLPTPHILASHCLPAAGQSCCGPASKTRGLVPGPAAGSSTSTDKDVGCPAQLLVLPAQSQSAGEFGSQNQCQWPHTTPTPK